jgi:nucleoside 2-deoxyribosyltransferase
MKTIYLAGSINGLNYEQATEWRKTLNKELTLKGFNVLDPMRGKDELEGKGIINDSKTIYEPSHILRRDLWDIKHSDIIVANLDNLGTLPMIGTLMELGTCLIEHKLVCLFNVPKKFKAHPFFNNFIICETIQDVIDYPFFE